jgi:hypothetical protein
LKKEYVEAGILFLLFELASVLKKRQTRYLCQLMELTFPENSTFGAAQAALQPLKPAVEVFARTPRLEVASGLFETKIAIVVPV